MDQVYSHRVLVTTWAIQRLWERNLIIPGQTCEEKECIFTGMIRRMLQVGLLHVSVGGIGLITLSEVRLFGFNCFLF